MFRFEMVVALVMIAVIFSLFVSLFYSLSGIQPVIEQVIRGL